MLSSGSSAFSIGGAITLSAGEAVITDSSGGSINLIGGAGVKNGGQLSFVGGSTTGAHDDGKGGIVSLAGGVSSANLGGDLLLMTGVGGKGSGSVIVESAYGTALGPSGGVSISSGTSIAGGSGTVLITSGKSQGDSAGSIFLQPGESSAASGGSVGILGGESDLQGGDVQVPNYIFFIVLDEQFPCGPL